VEFRDAHCDEESPGGTTGKFDHAEIGLETTEVIATNNKTAAEGSSWILEGTIGGTEVEITGGTVAFSGTMENNAGPPMKVTGSGTLEETEAKLLAPAAQANKCSVVFAPAEVNLESAEMELRFKPKVGNTLTQVTIADKPPNMCAKALRGTFNLEGFTGATGVSGEAVLPKYTGATLRFTPTMTEASLVFAGHAAKVEAGLTFRMAPIKGVEQNPIVLTTE
jgi:hypothetical protein